MTYSAYSCINMQNAGCFIVNPQHASGTDVLHDVVHGLLQVAVLADVLLHRIDGVHNGGMVTLEFGTDGFHAHTGDLADDIHRHLAGGTHIGAALFPADVGGNHIIGARHFVDDLFNRNGDGLGIIQCILDGGRRHADAKYQSVEKEYEKPDYIIENIGEIVKVLMGRT